MNETLQFRLCTAELILPLRARILRDGKSAETARFAEDHSEGTVHYCVHSGSLVIACLSLIPRESQTDNVFQLRGMAVEASWQTRGIGTRLLGFAEQDIHSRYGGAIIWCNVRKVAIPFYAKAGYRIVSEPFDIPGIGLHVVMQKQLVPEAIQPF